MATHPHAHQQWISMWMKLLFAVRIAMTSAIMTIRDPEEIELNGLLYMSSSFSPFLNGWHKFHKWFQYLCFKCMSWFIRQISGKFNICLVLWVIASHVTFSRYFSVALTTRIHLFLYFNYWNIVHIWVDKSIKVTRIRNNNTTSRHLLFTNWISHIPSVHDRNWNDNLIAFLWKNA